MEEMSFVFSFTFFFTAAHFHLALVAASISHFVTAATKFSCCSSNKKMSPLFFISRSKSLSPFFSLSFAGLPPTFSFSLSFSCSIFQICGYDNTDTETISAFRFRLYWLFCCLCFTRRRWLCHFPPKQPRVAFGLPYLLIELFYIGMPVVRTDCRAGGGSVYRHVITKFSQMGSLPHFLTHGAPLRALRAREVRYYPNRFRICSLLHLNVAIPVMFKSSYLVKLPNKKKPEEFWQKQCNALFFLQYVLFIKVTFVKRPPLHTLVKSYWKSLYSPVLVLAMDFPSKTTTTRNHRKWYEEFICRLYFSVVEQLNGG